MITCPSCGSITVLVWNEPSILAVPPPDWPDHLPYPEQPVEEAQHLVCTACGHEEHDIRELADG